MVPHRFFLAPNQLTRCVHKCLIQSPKVYHRFWLKYEISSLLKLVSHHVVCINTHVSMWKFTPSFLQSNTYYLCQLLDLELRFLVLLEKTEVIRTWEKFMGKEKTGKYTTQL